ncbi:MAG: hypothetical protein AB1394_04410 [Bacteroidota bacterium]
MNFLGLTYLLSLLVAGFVIITQGTNINEEKTTMRNIVDKNCRVEIFIIENSNTSQSGGNTYCPIYHSSTHSLFHSLDFQIEPAAARYENLFGTNRRLLTSLKI